MTSLWSLAAVGDALVAYLAMGAAFFIRFLLMHSSEQGITLSAYMGQLTLGVVTLVGIQFFRGLYQKASLLSRRDNTLQSIISAGIWLPVFLGASLFMDLQPQISRLFALIAGAILLIALPIWRLTLNFVLSRDRMVESLRKSALVIGWNSHLDRLYAHTLSTRYSPYRITACAPHMNRAFETEPPLELGRLPSFSNLESALKSGRFDTLIVSDLEMPASDLLELNRLCGREMVDLIILPNVLSVFLSRLNIRTVGSVPLMGTDQLPLEQPANRVLKRLVDVVGGIACLALAAPVIALFCFLVRRESPGPVFYRQLRGGKNGKLFDIIKIRSMRLNADKEWSGFSTENDSRCLKIGELMRRLNIDELPQFWNVIRGEMSLVGPRPERPELIKDFKEKIDFYNLRHAVKPGITGWAQINGWRGNTELEPRIQHDLEYMQCWSPWFDLYILLKTPFSSYRNAY